MMRLRGAAGGSCSGAPPPGPLPAERQMVDPIFGGVVRSTCGALFVRRGVYVGCAPGAGCTWGTRAGGLSRPRQRPPAIISAPLSGLWHEGVGQVMARRPSGPERRRARAVSIRPAIPRAHIRRKQGRSSPDRGASDLAGGRCRGCGKLPARVPHLHPAPSARAPHVHPAPGACTPRTPLAARTTRHTSIEWHRQDEVKPQTSRGRGVRKGDAAETVMCTRLSGTFSY